MHYLHALLGYFVMIVTIIFASKLLEWKFTDSVHNGLGTITLFVTILGTLTGSITAGVMRFYNGDKPWSEKERVEQIAKIHRWAGYLMLFIGNACCMTGVGHYYGDILNDEKSAPLGVASLLLFIFLVVLFEVIHRLRNKFSLGHIYTPVTI